MKWFWKPLMWKSWTEWVTELSIQTDESLSSMLLHLFRKWMGLLHWWREGIVHRRRFEIKKPNVIVDHCEGIFFFWMSIYQINLSSVCDIDFFGGVLFWNKPHDSLKCLISWMKNVNVITNCPIKSLIQELQEYTTEKVTLYLKVQLDSSNPIMALRYFLNDVWIKLSEDTVILQNVPPLCWGPNKIPVFTINK